MKLTCYYCQNEVSDELVYGSVKAGVRITCLSCSNIRTIVRKMGLQMSQKIMDVFTRMPPHVLHLASEKGLLSEIQNNIQALNQLVREGRRELTKKDDAMKQKIAREAEKSE